jgi:hypothetical protein
VATRLTAENIPQVLLSMVCSDEKFFYYFFLSFAWLVGLFVGFCWFICYLLVGLFVCLFVCFVLFLYSGTVSFFPADALDFVLQGVWPGVQQPGDVHRRESAPRQEER